MPGGYPIDIEPWPHVQPEAPEGDNFLRVDANPIRRVGEAFGQAFGAVGKGLQDIQQQQDNIHSAETVSSMSDALVDNTNNFMKLSGKDAINQQHNYIENADNIVQDALNKAGDPYSKLMILRESQRLHSSHVEMIGRHAAQEEKTYDANTAQMQLGSALGAAATYANGERYDDAATEVTNAFKSGLQLGHVKYGYEDDAEHGPLLTTFAKQQAGDVAVKIAQIINQKGGLTAAQHFREAVKDRIDPASYAQIGIDLNKGEQELAENQILGGVYTKTAQPGAAAPGRSVDVPLAGLLPQQRDALLRGARGRNGVGAVTVTDDGKSMRIRLPDAGAAPGPMAAAARAIGARQSVTGADQTIAPVGGQDNVDNWLRGQSYLETSLSDAPAKPGHSAAGYFQFEPPTAQKAIRAGLGDPRTGSYEQQAQKTWGYIQHFYPQAAQAIRSGDFQTAARLLRGEWPSLPGGGQPQSAERYQRWHSILGGSHTQPAPAEVRAADRGMTAGLVPPYLNQGELGKTDKASAETIAADRENNRAAIGSVAPELAPLKVASLTPGEAAPDVSREDPRMMDALRQAQWALPPGYHAQIYSAYRPHSSLAGSLHRAGKAVDIMIFDDQGREIPNEGSDPHSVAIYSRFARAAYGVVLDQYPELKGQFNWGGAFGSEGAGAAAQRPDLMHFDTGGVRGRYTQYRLENMGPLYRPGQQPKEATAGESETVAADPHDAEHGVAPDSASKQGPQGAVAPAPGNPGSPGVALIKSDAKPAPGVGAAADAASTPLRYSGRLVVGGQQFAFQSGGTGRGGLPYGTYNIHPGAVGAIGQRIDAIGGISDRNNPDDNSVADPRYPGHRRVGVEIHPWNVAEGAAGTEGCIGVDMSQWGAFKAAFAQAAAAGKQLQITVGPEGAVIHPAGEMVAAPGPILAYAKAALARGYPRSMVVGKLRQFGFSDEGL